MKILVVGKGGREHILTKTLRESASQPEMFVFPGSDAMEEIATRVKADNLGELVAWMKGEGVDLCVAGEEAWLAKGLADQCREAGIRVFGPVRESAQLESSKIFAKEFMFRNQVPTGGYSEVDSAEALKSAVTSYPCVLKFDGLAAGKGVAVCTNAQEVQEFSDRVFKDQAFGAGKMFVEEYLDGKELSVITAVADGDYQIFTPARDYKRQLNDDEGPNTGGMGSVASRALIPDELLEEIEEQVVKPAVKGLLNDSLDYRGFLYFGIMLTADGPKVMEFNCRFGDPEAQAIMPLIDGDFASFLYKAADGIIDHDALMFGKSWSICVVLASRDYPYSSGSGEVVTGLEEVSDGIVVHAGTVRNADGGYSINGGRVLSVVCRGVDREEALKKVYAEIKKVKFDGAQYRSDIGRLHFDEQSPQPA